MILCTICNQSKDKQAFRFLWKNDTSKGRCWDCYRQKRKDYKNLQTTRNRDATRYYNLRKERQTLINSFKDVPCQDCNGRFPPYVMDFDHREPDNKRREVSLMVDYKLENLLLEISKCDVVCANCHRIRTESKRINPGWGNRGY